MIWAYLCFYSILTKLICWMWSRIHDSVSVFCGHVSLLNWHSYESDLIDQWLTEVAGLAGQGVELLLIGPLLVIGSGDDEQPASPTEPTITQNVILDFSGASVHQWKLCSRTRSLCIFLYYLCQRVTTMLKADQKHATTQHWSGAAVHLCPVKTSQKNMWLHGFLFFF